MVEPPLKRGDRIELISMPKDPCPIPEGTKGTVQDCFSLKVGSTKWQVSVQWDNERTLSLVVPPDKYKIIGEDMTTGWIVRYRHIRYKDSYTHQWSELVEVPTKEQAQEIMEQLRVIAPDYEITLLEHVNGSSKLVLVQCRDKDNGL